MSMRSAIETASKPVLIRLAALPRLLIPVLMVALTVAGLMTKPPLSGAIIAVLALFISWLVFLSWPTLTTGGRIARLVILAMLWFSTGAHL